MPQVNIIKRIVLEYRNGLIVQASKDGFSDIEIGEMFNLDRTRIFTIRKEEKKRLQKKGR